MLIFLIILIILLLILILYNRSLLYILIDEYLFFTKTRKDIQDKQKYLLSKLLTKDLSKYPIMTKQDINQNFDTKSYITAYTSGTSGNVISISHDYESFTKTQIITGLRIFKNYIRPDLFLGRMKIVFLISTNRTLTNLLASKTPFPVSLLAQITVISFDDKIEDIINKINGIQPDIVVSYPTFLETLIMYKELKIKPTFIVTGSEALTSVIRNKLEERFLTSTIIETYGCTELPPLAVSCKYNNLHLQEDCCYIELIDENNKLLPFEKGIVSHKILLTNLINTYQPIIRYCLEDSIEILEDCPCQSPYKTIKVHGRADDIFYLIDVQKKIKRVLPASIESSIFLDVPLISYQVIHVTQNVLLILYVTNSDDCYDILKNKIDIYFKKHSLQNVNYKLERRNKIERQKGGKIRQIISLV